MLILSKHENPDPQVSVLERAILECCRAEQVDCLVISPLYRIAESSKLWANLADRSDHAVLAGWFHPRPAHWLLRRHQIVIEESCILDLRTFADAFSVLAAAASLGAGVASETVSPNASQELRAVTRARWYPVLDGSRCVNCQHCLQFCLFGVYDLDAAGRVRVQNPDQCKNGCPACSRICPQSAIMFPLYEKDSAIAGAPGEYVIPDAAAKRMFYARTKQPCPACGQKAARKSPPSASSDRLCPECGRPLPDGVQPNSSASDTSPETNRSDQAVKPAFDDLDLLVDQLDQAMQRRD